MRLTQGGADQEVLWSRDGSELFYRNGVSVLAIPVTVVGARFEQGRTVELFEDRFARAPQLGHVNYAVAPDGRFLMLLEDQAGVGELVLIQNWKAKVAAAFAEEGG